MKYLSLDKVLKNIYDNRVTFIKSKNIELERKYFTENGNLIPMSEIMQDASYEDHFINFKNAVKNNNAHEISVIFMLLQKYFLFSYGHDMIFKKKLEADIFTSVPMENFIYPKLSEAVKERYNDTSVMKENPNRNANIEDIGRLVFTYTTEIQPLLYLLYCNDFQFPKGWERICPDTYEEVLNILNKSKITIGDFLHALIDFKCKIMSEIFIEIKEPRLKRTYLEKVETLKKEKHEETKTFPLVDLPITYFLNHTFSDFMNKERKSTILEDTTPNKEKKILFPKL